MPLVSLQSLLCPLGEERSFWATMREFCDAEGDASWDFEAWDSILELARMRGIAALDGRGGFFGVFGFALLRRYRWLVDARNRGLTPQQAEREFCARIDLERRNEREKQEQIAIDHAKKVADDARKRRGKDVAL